MSFQLSARSFPRADGCGLTASLPHVPEHFTADAGLDRFASGHHAARGGQDADAQPGQHIRHIVAAEVDPAPGPADPLNAGDHALAAGAVLEEHLELRLDTLARCCLEHLETLDVAFALQDPRNLDLET